jgi:hypothetical protein
MYIELLSHIGELAKQTPTVTNFEDGPKISLRFHGPDPFLRRESSAGWTIQFENADWKVTNPEGVVCDCHDDHVSQAANFYQCTWGTLDQIYIDERFGLRLTFESGVVIHAAVAKESSGLIQWQLINPWGTHLRVYGGGGWTLHYDGEATPAYFWSPDSPNISLETAECSPRLQ